MIYYFLPNPKLHGGIKVGYQFTELLNNLGIPAVVASPAGVAPQWFKASVAVVDERDALGRIAESDWVIFSLQSDYERLRETPGKLAFHCQGTNPAHDPTFSGSLCRYPDMLGTGNQNMSGKNFQGTLLKSASGFLTVSIMPATSNTRIP